MKSIASGLPGVREHNLTLAAASRLRFPALVPALIAFVSMYGLVADPADVQRQVEDVAGALPAEVRDFLVFQLTSIIRHTRVCRSRC